MSFRVSSPIEGNRETFQIYGNRTGNHKETVSLKALALKVLQGNRQGNFQETASFTGNKHATLKGIPSRPFMACRIYSEILDCHIWICDTEHDKASIKTNEAIYTHEEIAKLKELSPDREMLRTINNVKTVFPEGKVIQ